MNFRIRVVILQLSRTCSCSLPWCCSYTWEITFHVYTSRRQCTLH